MNDQAVATWLQNHQILAYTLAMLVLGTGAGFVAPRTVDEQAAFVKSAPRLAALVEFARRSGLDATTLWRLLVGIARGPLAARIPLSFSVSPATVPGSAPATEAESGGGRRETPRT